MDNDLPAKGMGLEPGALWCRRNDSVSGRRHSTPPDPASGSLARTRRSTYHIPPRFSPFHEAPMRRSLHALTPAAFATVVLAAALRAQSVADTSLFRPLDLPTPNAYRSAGGQPGPAYWQNRANYAIEASLDTAKNEIRGTARILYENHSPDALDFLWLQVEQNLFAPGSINEATAPPPLLFGTISFAMANAGFRGGITIDRLDRRRPRALPRYLWDTMLRVDLPAPLRTGESVTIDVAWHFPVPVDGAGRMGRDGSLYEIAQWYPRLAVYDDVHGWNTMPYIGAGEFYLEYGDFDVRLTVPARLRRRRHRHARERGRGADRRASATGSRAARAGTTPVAIIAADEAGNAAPHPARRRPAPSPGTSAPTTCATWPGPPRRTSAGTPLSWNGILIQTLYRPTRRRSGPTEGIRMARARHPVLLASSGRRTRIRRRRRSRGRSAGWSTRCSPSCRRRRRARGSTGC